jgi:hypothetical protein
MVFYMVEAVLPEGKAQHAQMTRFYLHCVSWCPVDQNPESLWRILVWVLQRNRTNKVCLCVSGYKKFSYEDLTHAGMEAVSQDFLGELANWTPRKAAGIALVWFWKLENQEYWWCKCSPSLKAGKLKTQKGPMFQIESRGRKKLMSQFEGLQTRIILSYLGNGQPFYSGWIRLTQSTTCFP